MILGLTNLNFYLSCHNAFSMQILESVGKKFNMHFYVRRLDTTPTYMSPYITYSSDVRPSDTNILKDISKLKPKIIINFIENYFPSQVIKQLDAYKVYFVRSCDAELEGKAYPFTRLPELIASERAHVLLYDEFITDSPTSAEVFAKHYNKTCKIMWEYINPSPYRQLINKADLNDKRIYNVGRHDRQKRVYLLKSYTKGIVHIGKTEVDNKDDLPDISSFSKGCMPWPDYMPLIETIPVGAFPAVWESNGYAVQECFAMGKVPIVQWNSGGNTRLCTSDNSIITDFQSRWNTLPSKVNKTMLEAAAETITLDMYKLSLEKFGNFINNL